MSSCDFIAGWGGGIIGLVTGHPFDTVKVNQQSKGVGLLQCIKYIYRTRGAKGFFRGLAFPMLADGTLNSIFFGVYGHAVEGLSRYQDIRRQVANLNDGAEKNIPNSSTDHESTLKKEDFRNFQPTYLIYFLSGCAGGAPAIVVGCPVELVKIKLQTAKVGSGTKGPLTVIQNIIYTQGPRGLFKGFGIMAMRDIPGYGVYMSMYAVFSDALKKVPFFANKDGSPNSLRTVFAGGLAGMCSWCSIIPIDTIKSRLQADDPVSPRYNGIRDCALKVLKTEGYAGFFKGYLPLALRAFPVNAATFLAYEWIGWTCISLSSGSNH